MQTRQLDNDEWVHFFNGFSRQFRGRPMTVRVIERDASAGRARIIARRLPLMGISAEAGEAGGVESLEIMVGESADEHIVHTVRRPERVTVCQISNGADEVLIIDSAVDPTVRVDFGPALAEEATPAEP